jgi:SAM-dependent methyltransferase
MPVHSAARVGFSKSSEAYDRGRPEYPPTGVRTLRDALGLGPLSRVVELGAGTGKFTRALVEVGLSPIAVEPVAEMRARLRAVDTAVPVVAGVAEHLPFRSGTLDAVCAAQAFHWFDLTPTLGELSRVLRPGGGVGILWNLRDESVDWQRRMTEVIERHRPPGLPTHRNTGWKEAIAADGRFAPVSSASEGFVQRCTREQLRDRVGSISFVAALAPEPREALLREVLDVAEPGPESDGRSTFEIPYRTQIYWTHRVKH